MEKVFNAGQVVYNTARLIEQDIQTEYDITVEVCITTSSTGGTVLQLAKDGEEIFRDTISKIGQIAFENKLRAELQKQREIDKLLN